MFNKKMAIIPALLSVFLLAFPVSALAGVAGSSTIMVTVPALGSSGGSFTSGGTGDVQQSQPVVSLDEAISTAKQVFPIPAQDTNFSSNLFKPMNRQIWDLRWMDSQNQPSGLDVQVDAVTGEIISMRVDQLFNSQAPGLQLPTLTEADAQKIAMDLLNRLDSAKIAELQLQKRSTNVLNPNNYSIPLYSFSWQRTVNNIPFSGDGVTIQVNGANGQVMFYNQNWTTVNTELPDPKKAISVAKAQEIFQANDMLQLQYFLSSAYLPYGNRQAKPQVKLVYTPDSKYINGAIDGLSGEPVQLAEGSFNNLQGVIGWSPIYSGTGPLGGLSSQEQGAGENTNLISQDAALKIAAQWVDLPEGVVFQNASLNTYGMDPKQKVWNLSWGPDPEKSKPGQIMLFVNATVDAVTGELLNFNNPVLPGENGLAGQITREQALKIARDFLQKIQLQYSAQVELRDEDPLVNSPSQNGVENFYFYRTANDIPFMNNGFNITVDTNSKRILNYNCNWSDIELPVPDGVIKPAQASAAYLKGNPLVLSYVQMYTANKPGAVKLVYLPNPNVSLPLGSNLVDAKSGALLGWDGQDVSRLPQSAQFKDISGNFAEKEITLLGQAGIFAEYDDQFKPEENISTISLLRAMMAVQTGVWSTYLQSDQDILKAAQKLGWVDQAAQPADLLNRVTLAQLMIHYLKLDNLAQLKDAFQEPYTDVAAFPPGTEGYITFGRALGLFHFDGDQFKPEQPVTRAEAAYAIVQALKFEGQGK